MTPVLLALMCLIAAMAGGSPTDAARSDDMPIADLVLVNGNIHTVDDAAPHAQALAARGGRIIYVGDDAGAAAHAGPSTRRIDLRGATVVPGLIDAHGHVGGLGLLASRVDLVGTVSAEEVASRVAARAAATPHGRWISGRGWDQNDWKQTSFPTHRVLDAAAPDHPVALERIDGHALWTNAAAMKMARVTKHTPDPPGGRIIRDDAGEPTGVFIDHAADLIEAAIPAPGRAERREMLEAAMRRCLAAGLTGVHDAGVSALDLDLYRELLVRDGFPFRIYAMLEGETTPGGEADRRAWLEQRFQQGPEIGLGDGSLTVRAVKLYIDGALGSRGAALLAPYADDPGNTGLLRMEPPAMRALAERAARAGFQVCVHAIGDRGNRLALDALEAATRAGGQPDARHRVEHAQVLSPDDLPRFASSGIIASMQPTHATSDMYWAEDRLGPERARGAYAWASLRATGARLACGSDFPVESERPLLGFYAAVTRQDEKGWPAGGWMPRQVMTRDQALRCFTADAAWAAFEERERGSIAVGKRADLTVLSQDILRVPASSIPGTSVLLTIVGGRVAYEMK